MVNALTVDSASQPSRFRNARPIELSVEQEFRDFRALHRLIMWENATKLSLHGERKTRVPFPWAL